MKNLFKTNSDICSRFVFQHESVDHQDQVPPVTTEDIKNMNDQEKHVFILNTLKEENSPNRSMALQNITEFSEHHQGQIVDTITTNEELAVVLENINSLPAPLQADILYKQISIPTKTLENQDQQYLKKYQEFGYTSQEGNYRDDIFSFAHESQDDLYSSDNPNERVMTFSKNSLGQIPDPDPNNPGGTLTLSFKSNFSYKSNDVKEFAQVNQFDKNGETVSITNYSINENGELVYRHGYFRLVDEYDSETKEKKTVNKLSYVSKDRPVRDAKSIFTPYIQKGVELASAQLQSAVQGPMLAMEKYKKEVEQEDKKDADNMIEEFIAPEENKEEK